eukprot:PhM_4_TR2224/c0_g1_i1/m.25711/K21053/ade; adenine deaminase
MSTIEEKIVLMQRTMQEVDAPHELDDFIAGLPKVELHLHIEGSFEPELLFKIAGRNGIILPYASVEELRAAYAFTNLQSFLDVYYQGMNALQTEQDFYDLAFAYFERSHKDNVRHAEIFFDPQGHTSRGVSMETMVNGLTRAMLDAETTFGLTSKLIPSFLRHLSEEDGFECLEQALPFKDKFVAVGLDSSEVGHPPSKFERLFKKCAELGLKRVAHAGEEGPPEYIHEALNLLNVHRIDHGVRSIEDDALLEKLIATRMPLTVCPLSNVKLCVTPDLSTSSLKKMLDRGACVTLNSDDPAYFGGYMTQNYRACAIKLGLTKSDLVKATKNAIEASFLSEEEKAKLYMEVDAYVSSH